MAAQAQMIKAMAGAGGISGGGMTGAMNPMMSMMSSMMPQPGMLGDKKTRELYVGNVPVGVTNEQVKEVLGGAMMQVGLNEQEGNPIVQCFMSGNFGFCEFRTASEATAGMNLDKIYIGNVHLNIGRPSKYVGPATQHLTWAEFVTDFLQKKPELAGKIVGMPPGAEMGYTAAQMGAVGGHASVGNQATKALRELFISLPAGVTEMQVTQFLNTQCYEQNICQMDITPVLSVRVNQDKAFGFVEFATPEICDVRRTSLCRPLPACLNARCCAGRVRQAEQRHDRRRVDAARSAQGLRADAGLRPLPSLPSLVSLQRRVS